MLKELSGESRIATAKSFDAHPGLFTLGSSILDRGDVLAGPDLAAELQQILLLQCSRACAFRLASLVSRRSARALRL